MTRRNLTMGLMMTLAGWTLGGCRTSLHQTTMERVDQDLHQGNRGYLVGTAPPVADRSASRELYELEIDLPAPRAAGRAGRVKRGAATGAVAPFTGEAPAPASSMFPWPSTPAPAPVSSYRVRKGDSLWKIANRPEIYGDGNQWRAIYEANREKIPDPNHLRAGLVLKIPPAPDGSRPRRMRHGDTYKK
ncbi:MAG: LysM peptidoglycan-binding domain-containing protein [Candidatus Omnitrophica bacterium]|nr:LysM peptidoglycan-binding domain-containing protein [Candidatus Omnitrophota bacterium]